MAQPAPTQPAQPSAALDPDQIVVVDGASWSDYQRMLEIRGERPRPRLAYAEGRLEIMSPSKHHESIASVIGRLVEAWCFEQDVDITPYGSWTLEKKEAARGAEADECYVLGDVADPERPDIAIEVIWTSGGLDKLEVYRALGIPEVWFWQDDALSVHLLRGGSYQAAERSEALPGLDLGLLASFVEVRPMTRAVRAYRAALRART